MDVPLMLRAELSEHLKVRTVSVSVGPQGEAYHLLVTEADPDSGTPRPFTASVLIHDGWSARRIVLHDRTLAHGLVQPLPGERILVVGGHCRRFQDGTVERNAAIYGADGVLRHEATFGNGIWDVQTTTRGAIWVSYSDEGVFGNSGWGDADGPRPIGSSGLVRFDDRGAVEWAYAPPAGIDAIADCYALNASDDATWAYYYTDFPLVRIDRDGAVRAWRTDVSGAYAFATDGDRVLFYGGYGDERERCLLGRLQEDGIVTTVPCRLILPSGEPLEAARVIGRGPLLHAFAGDAWYSTDVRAFA
jgi:hypothetical protein